MSLTTDRSQQKLTLAQFVEQLPDEEGRYELVDGDIVRILANRQHEDIADFIARQFDREVERLNLKYRVSGRIVIRTETKDGIEQGRHPDVSVVDRSVWEFNRSAFVYLLDNKGVYQPKIYRDSDRIISQTFPDLILTPEEIFNS
jgi:Uma2 family endonuclease